MEQQSSVGSGHHFVLISLERLKEQFLKNHQKILSSCKMAFTLINIFNFTLNQVFLVVINQTIDFAT